MSSVFYPRSLARLTVTVQTSRERDELEEVVFDAIPRDVKIERNEFSKADECTMEFDSAHFPVLPRNIRQALALVHIGDTGRLGRQLEPSSSVWLGYVDDPDLSITDSGGTIHWRGRDYTGLLLDARRPPLRIVPTYGDDLETALRRILDDLPGGENIKLKLVDGETEALQWPSLSDAAPPGLQKEKVAHDPNDTIWKLIERLCDPFGLIPQVKLDTLEIGTSRGAQRPERFPLFVLGGDGPGGILEYRERRVLSKIREGITLSGYDLSTGSYIIAQWPPSGDATVAKKLKATKAATGKSGKKTTTKPATVGANAAPIDKNDKRHAFVYGNVANEATLLDAAKALYEGRSRQEFEGSLKCKRMRVPFVGANEQITSATPEFDVTRLTSGDRILVDVLPDQRQLLAGVDSTAQRVAMLIGRGYDRSVASILVKTYERGVSNGIEVYVRSVSFSLSESDGFSLDVNFQALLSVGR